LFSIHCLPEDVVVPTDGATDLLTALLEADIPAAHDCGGNARCSICRVRILGGLEGLNNRNSREQIIADRLALPDEIRLACQTFAEAGVTLQRLVLDELDGVLADQTRPERATGPDTRRSSAAMLRPVARHAISVHLVASRFQIRR
jgi:adenylate cyclase